VERINNAPFKTTYFNKDILIKAFERFFNLKLLSALLYMYPFKVLDIRFDFLLESTIRNVCYGQ